MPDEDRLRIEFIRRLCEVPGESLPEIERFLDHLAPPGGKPKAAPAKQTLVAPTRDWPHAPMHRLSEHGT